MNRLCARALLLILVVAQGACAMPPSRYELWAARQKVGYAEARSAATYYCGIIEIEQRRQACIDKNAVEWMTSRVTMDVSTRSASDCLAFGLDPRTVEFNACMHSRGSVYFDEAQEKAIRDIRRR